MKVAVLGTGMVGRALAGKLYQLGHDVSIGTREVQRTLSSTRTDGRTIPFAQWQTEHPGIRLVTFSDAASDAELVVNATAGAVSLGVLAEAGSVNLAGKVLLDVAQPLDRASGVPPLLTVANTDSLGERIQRAFPDAQVVKALNTVLADLMVDPARLPGRHSIFVAGDDETAKTIVRRLLESFGWPAEDIIDLGGITAARATEMYAALSFTVSQSLGTFAFNIAVVHPPEGTENSK